MTRTPVWNAWAGMRARCYCKTNTSYPHYGGKGIGVCESWTQFEAFYADMGEPPEGYTLDRIDPRGDYEPGNCRWATWTQQERNRTNNVHVVYQGVEMTLSGAAEASGVPYKTVWMRRKYGWPQADWFSVSDYRKVKRVT
jgi:hypothetical protein